MNVLRGMDGERGTRTRKEGEASNGSLASEKQNAVAVLVRLKNFL